MHVNNNNPDSTKYSKNVYSNKNVLYSLKIFGKNILYSYKNVFHVTVLLSITC